MTEQTWFEKIIADLEKAGRRIAELEQTNAELSYYKWVYELIEAHQEVAHTFWWDEHPEDYNDACLCSECRSLMASDG